MLFFRYAHMGLDGIKIQKWAYLGTILDIRAILDIREHPDYTDHDIVTFTRPSNQYNGFKENPTDRIWLRLVDYATLYTLVCPD